jgi:hypothetical protein
VERWGGRSSFKRWSAGVGPMSDTHTPTPYFLIYPGVGRIMPGVDPFSTPTPMRSLQHDHEQETDRGEHTQAQHRSATIAHVDTMMVLRKNMSAC